MLTNKFFFKLLFNVKLIYSIQVLGGPGLGELGHFFLQWWGRGRGPVGQMPIQSMVLKNALELVKIAQGQTD
jgi:hypothetical protein